MKFFKTLLLLFLMLVGNVTVAQSITPPSPNPPPPGLPIDNILWILGVVAVVFGVYLLKKNSSEVVK